MIDASQFVCTALTHSAAHLDPPQPLELVLPSPRRRLRLSSVVRPLLPLPARPSAALLAQLLPDPHLLLLPLPHPYVSLVRAGREMTDDPLGLWIWCSRRYFFAQRWYPQHSTRCCRFDPRCHWSSCSLSVLLTLKRRPEGRERSKAD